MCPRDVRAGRERLDKSKGKPGEPGGFGEHMDKKETKKTKNQRKTRKRKTTGKSLEKDFVGALKEAREPLKELRGLWKDLKEGIGL
jgi:hypothetical protein